MTSWIAAVLSALELASPTAAPAAPARPALAVIAVADLPGPSPELAALTGQLREQAARAGLTVLSADETRGRMLGQRDSAPLPKLEADFAAARARGLEGAYADAARRMRLVAEAFERLPESDDTFLRWSRALLQLARFEKEMGHAEEAGKVVDRLLRANRLAQADPDVFPSEFVELFEERRAAHLRQPRRRLEVTSANPQAVIYLEGHEIGIGSAVASLVPGSYRLSGSLGLIRLPVRTVEIGAQDVQAALLFAHAQALRPERGPGLAAPPGQWRPLAVALASAVDSEKIWTATTRGEGKEGQLVVEVYARDGRKLDGAALRLVGTVPPPEGVAALAAWLGKGEHSSLIDFGLLIPVPVEPAKKGARQPCASDVDCEGGQRCIGGSCWGN